MVLKDVECEKFEAGCYAHHVAQLYILHGNIRNTHKSPTIFSKCFLRHRNIDWIFHSGLQRNLHLPQTLL